MPSFVVETYVTAEGRDEFARAVEDLRTATAASAGLPRVRLVRSFLVPGDEMGFHILEASSAADVAAVTSAAGIDAERVVEIVTIEAPVTEGTR
jgi:hypothetical protein